MESVMAVVVVVGIVVLVLYFKKKGRDSVSEKYHFSPEQKQMLEMKKLWVGMPAEAMYAILGPGKQNKTTTSGGEHIQHVFEYEKEYHYVYTENGVVSSWQGK